MEQKPPIGGQGSEMLLVLWLTQDVDEAIRAGDLVIADEVQFAASGDYVVVPTVDGDIIVPWCEGLTYTAKVTQVISYAEKPGLVKLLTVMVEGIRDGRVTMDMLKEVEDMIEEVKGLH